MDVQVLFFARSRELTGTREATLTLQPGSTTTTLMQQLLQQVTGAAGGGGAGAVPPPAGRSKQDFHP